jgi:hypothetical protein
MANSIATASFDHMSGIPPLTIYTDFLTLRDGDEARGASDVVRGRDARH